MQHNLVFLYFQYELSCLNFSCIQYFEYLTIWTVSVIFQCSALICFVSQGPRWTCHCCICFASTKCYPFPLASKSTNKDGQQYPSVLYLTGTLPLLLCYYILVTFLRHAHQPSPTVLFTGCMLPLIIMTVVSVTFLCTFCISTTPFLCCFQDTYSKGEKEKV